MVTIITTVIIISVLLVFLAEVYKIYFEKRKEAHDERGQFLLLQTKHFSYRILSSGILIGVALVAIFDILPKAYFIYYVMMIFFIQSIASSAYLLIVRRI